MVLKIEDRESGEVLGVTCFALRDGKEAEVVGDGEDFESVFTGGLARLEGWMGRERHYSSFCPLLIQTLD